MFTYTHTITKFSFTQHEINLLNQHADCFLMSLIDGLRQTSFGIDTLITTANQIESTHQNFPNKTWIIDSGGYSIIVGDVSPRDMSKFIDCYNYYLDNFAENNCNYILSLDIPILLEYPEYNTVDYIKEMNYLACQRSINILENKKTLYDKYTFVWHFKIQKQFDIWCQLYNDLYKNIIDLKNFAIGGLVGLRGITGITFSPFIACCYKIIDILYEKNLDYESILHILGVYGLHDRFLMGFYDRLFNRVYFENKNCSVKITFDTINHLISGLFNVRELYQVIFEDKNMIYDLNQNLINKMHLIIENEETLEEVKRNLDAINKNQLIYDTNVVALLEVIKQQTFNKIMDYAIDHYNILELFINSKNFNQFKNNFKPIFYKLQKDFPFIFSNKLNKLLLNFQYSYAFHNWWVKGRDPDEFQKLMSQFIKLINFPGDLS